ncbi:hypothetical protein [Pandoraea pnomenusa]|uniref:Type III secretion system protein, YseE family n=1 Tax=Pandoraea pnomenusa TaxID=93220 RepID=A0A378YV19_9BURK|nr:hypothetical protein [Pandoraea pnomenusa]MBN9096173.1 hypothetical protein [Pandoraea pnomenusa]SUA80623.1 Uncharacterised protein [Pandoraea pnomenusa]
MTLHPTLPAAGQGLSGATTRSPGFSTDLELRLSGPGGEDHARALIARCNARRALIDAALRNPMTQANFEHLRVASRALKLACEILENRSEIR